jgi:hypothetical protein
MMTFVTSVVAVASGPLENKGLRIDTSDSS